LIRAQRKKMMANEEARQNNRQAMQQLKRDNASDIVL